MNKKTNKQTKNKKQKTKTNKNKNKKLKKNHFSDNEEPFDVLVFFNKYKLIWWLGLFQALSIGHILTLFRKWHFSRLFKCPALSFK